MAGALAMAGGIGNGWRQWRQLMVESTTGTLRGGKLHALVTHPPSFLFEPCQQARGKANMPDTVDKMENLLQQRNRLIPKVQRYYGFFGNLSSGESLNFSNNIG